MKRASLMALALFVLAGCSIETVQPGNVGIKVFLMGGDKGVDHEVVGVGRYFLGINTQLYTFPTFEQNYTWTRNNKEGDTRDESFTFQTKEGLAVNADMGITYHIPPDKVATVFAKYRRGIAEITDTFVHNHVRDALNEVSSTMPVESVYGEGKAKLIEDVQGRVTEQLRPIGIEVTKIYLVGTMRLPETVTSSINAKITATQQAQQSENELRRAEAEAKKSVATAEGEAKMNVARAEGEAQAILAKAKAQAEANLLVAKSLTSELIQYKKLEKWDGKLPQFSGGGVPLINIGDNK
jgi:regulator of protease activity HflC (stomatin/prohibitin superfamily)